jgi:ribonuclease D
LSLPNRAFRSAGSPDAIHARMLITKSDALADFCRALRGAPYIAVDTEFLREKSYFAHLCLVQVAYGEHAACIDPLAPDIDMGPLRELLLDTGTIKVLHSATQDLEIFLQKLGAVPTPIFDTQIAASVCGMGEQPGYASLVQSMLDIRVDKSSQTTDWSLRPLSQRQLDYALSDVTHLCKVYELMVGKLEKSGRLAWVAQDMEGLHDPARYEQDPSTAWKRIKIRRPDGKTLAVLRELAAWRERRAVARDLPRNWVLHNDALAEIAQNQPRTVENLVRVRRLKDQVARGRDGTELLACVERALASPESDWPQVEKRARKLTGHEDLRFLLQALLQRECAAHGVAPSMVAGKNELDRIATEDEPDVPALRGWRREVFGAKAVDLCAGRLALTGRQGKVAEVSLAE